jgi:hypothetical protein
VVENHCKRIQLEGLLHLFIYLQKESESRGKEGRDSEKMRLLELSLRGTRRMYLEL